MGMDTVYLVMGFEKAFGVPIPNPVAERMRTVRDVVDFFCSELTAAPSEGCSTQSAFYQLRSGLASMSSGGVSLRPDTPLAALCPPAEWPRVWESARKATPDSDWPAKIPRRGRFFGDGPETLRELVLYITATRPVKYPRGARWTRDEIIGTVRHVTYDETGVWNARLDDSFVEDLRLD